MVASTKQTRKLADMVDGGESHSRWKTSSKLGQCLFLVEKKNLIKYCKSPFWLILSSCNIFQLGAWVGILFSNYRKFKARILQNIFWRT